MRFDIHNIVAQAEELFNQIDIDGNGSLSEKELKVAAKKAREKADEKRHEAEAAIRRTPEMRRRSSSANGSTSTGQKNQGNMALIFTWHEPRVYCSMAPKVVQLLQHRAIG